MSRRYVTLVKSDGVGLPLPPNLSRALLRAQPLLLHQRVHRAEPQRRHEREQNSGRVADGQVGRLVVRTEDLVAAAGEGVVIRVAAGSMKNEDVGASVVTK